MIDSITQKTARRMTLHAQLLDGRTKIRKGKGGVKEAVEHLGYVQIDTISVIERAHHHVLWTRVPGYRPEHLRQAHAVDRSLFEYWGHAASYLPLSDYRFYIPMMRSFYNPSGAWWRGWGEKYCAYLEPVLKRIREEGPLAARDFENPGGARKGPWWDWKPAKAALEMLFWRGELMIAERIGFERVYDLTERVLPEGTDTRPPDPGELSRFIVNRALNALGIAGEKEIREYIRIGDREIVGKALKEMLAANEIVRLDVKGENGASYAFANALEKASIFRAVMPRVRLLSPFDNLASSRLRLKQRFDFDYALECYTPSSKRKHGYFVLPVLFGDEIVGRLDPKADRPEKTFVVRRLAIHPEFGDNGGLIVELGRALSDLARFNGCPTVLLGDVRPKKLLAPLKKALASGMGG
jgi:uncharacterized protein YcaQ